MFDFRTLKDEWDYISGRVKFEMEAPYGPTWKVEACCRKHAFHIVYPKQNPEDCQCEEKYLDLPDWQFWNIKEK